MNRFLVSIAAADSISQAAEVCQISDNFFAPLKALPNVHQTLYAQVPPLSENDFSVSECACNSDGTFRCKYRNFGLVQGYLPSYLSLCGLKEAYWCPEIANGTCDFSGREISIYHSDRPTETSLTWGAVNFDGTAVIAIESASQPVYVKSNIGTLEFFRMRHVLPAGVTAQDLEAAFLEANPRFPSADKMNEFCRGEWFPHAEECFGTESEALAAMEDSLERCALSAGIGDFDHEFSDERGWCVSGICEPGEFPSSSSGAESSSSAFTNRCLRHPLKSIPSDPQNSCFSSGGKCYRCNPARGESCSAEWLWTADFDAANVGWWLVEVDCATGEAAERERLGACEVHPFSSMLADPEKACFAADGQCFRCNPDRGSECENEWLWIYAFNPANVGWWYTPVSCENPDGDAEGKCPEGSRVLRKSLENTEKQLTSNDEILSAQKPGKYFDVLGRKSSRSTDVKQKIYSSLQKNTSASVDEKILLRGESPAFECDNYSGRWKCYSPKFSNLMTATEEDNSCGILGVDYGIIENGRHVGGITCAKASVDKKNASYKKREIVGTCSSGVAQLNVLVLVETETVFVQNEIHYVKPGFVFDDGYEVTEEDSRGVRLHELGHQKFNTCVKFPENFTLEYECICEDEFNKRYEEDYEKKMNLLKNESQRLLEKQADLFHSIYSEEGFSTTYECP